MAWRILFDTIMSIKMARQRFQSVEVGLFQYSRIDSSAHWVSEPFYATKLHPWLDRSMRRSLEGLAVLPRVSESCAFFVHVLANRRLWEGGAIKDVQIVFSHLYICPKSI